MEHIKHLMHQDLTLVNATIIQDLKSDVTLIQQISHYIINAGGKRIRPLLTLLCGRVVGYKDNQDNFLHKMAAMIEYIHTATLLHDDVVDESNMRRGRKTANSIFGNAASILVGDFIYTRSFQMMVATNSISVCKIMANGTNKIAEGEVLQLLNIGRSDVTENEYMAVIYCKTAALFEAAAKTAAIIANATHTQEENLGAYALNLGIAFQIMDDILDYAGETAVMGKNVGDDLMEGKITLPLIYTLAKCTSSEQKLIRNGIETPHNASLNDICSLIIHYKGIDYCVAKAKSHIDTALNNLYMLPPSIYRDALEDLARLSLTRTS